MTVPIGKDITFSFDAVKGSDEYMVWVDHGSGGSSLAGGEEPNLSVIFLTDNKEEKLTIQAIKFGKNKTSFDYTAKTDIVLKFSSEGELSLTADQSSVMAGSTFELVAESTAESVSFYSNTKSEWRPMEGTLLGTVQNDGSNVFHYSVSGIQTANEKMLFCAVDSDGKTSKIVSVKNEFKGTVTAVKEIVMNGKKYKIKAGNDFHEEKLKSGSYTIEMDVPADAETFTCRLRTVKGTIGEFTGKGGDHVSFQVDLSKKEDERLTISLSGNALGYIGCDQYIVFPSIK